jgi:hypothetical protein
MRTTEDQTHWIEAILQYTVIVTFDLILELPKGNPTCEAATSTL